MSIFKITFMSAPAVPHVYCQLFVAERRDETWALCGNLTMRKSEFDDFQTACPDLEFQNVTPSADIELPYGGEGGVQLDDATPKVVSAIGLGSVDETLARVTENRWQCHTCGEVYKDGDARPGKCIAHIAPLDCAYNSSEAGKVKG